MTWYVQAIRRYTDFAGRVGRPAFWWFYLTNVVIEIILGTWGNYSRIGYIISALYGLFILLPSLAIGARRLHDTNRTGWWQLIYIIPLIGWIVLVVFWAMPGDPASNRFGPPPPTTPV